jgi:hypothetical protein
VAKSKVFLRPVEKAWQRSQDVISPFTQDIRAFLEKKHQIDACDLVVSRAELIAILEQSEKCLSEFRCLYCVRALLKTFVLHTGHKNDTLRRFQGRDKGYYVPPEGRNTPIPSLKST